MIVERMMVKVKPGHQTSEVADLTLAEEAAYTARSTYSGAFRVYTPRFSGQPSTQVILEWEYEDMAEHERMWAEWNDLPTTPAFLQKWRELVEPGITTEIWNVQAG